MTRVKYLGKIQKTMAQYEALTTLEKYADYDITDYPNSGITNAQMTFALTCARLFPEGTTMTCNDGGTYQNGHIYQIQMIDNSKHWVDITPSAGLETITITTTSKDLVELLKDNTLCYLATDGTVQIGEISGKTYALWGGNGPFLAYKATNAYGATNILLLNTSVNTETGMAGVVVFSSYYTQTRLTYNTTSHALTEVSTGLMFKKVNGSQDQANLSDCYVPSTSGETGQILVSGGTGNAPTWSTTTIDTLVSTDEENTFTAKQNFNGELEINGVTNHNADVNISNHVLKILDNTEDNGVTRDVVTTYNADKIVKEDNSQTTTLTLPSTSGTIVTDATIDLQHSKLQNRDSEQSKEDTWLTEEPDAAIAITHENTTSTSSVSVQKSYAEISAYDSGDNPSSAGMVVTTNSMTLKVSDLTTQEGPSTTLSITSDGATINGKTIATDITVDSALSDTSTNPVQNKVINTALKDKLNVFAPGESNRVYVRKEDNLDSSLPFTYSAEANSIAYRNASGQLQVEDPSQDSDAANKKYVESKSQKYLSLTGESGTLDDTQYALVTTYDNLIIQRVGVDFRRCGYPSNGQGNYIFITPYYAATNGSEEFDAYVITIKQDKTWEFKLKNFLQVSEQTYAPVVTITPETATNGTLSEDDFANVTENDDTIIKLNNELYRKADDGHTVGMVSYVHTGWNGTAIQDKSINITTSTKAWTLVVGKNKYYRHYICLEADGKTLYYDFSSTQKEAYTAETLPVMPDTIITAIQVVSGGYYSSVSGLVYRNSEDALKVIVHGMITSDGSSMTYLSLTGSSATFVADVVMEQ